MGVILPMPQAPLRVVDEQMPFTVRCLHTDVIPPAKAAGNSTAIPFRSEHRPHGTRKRTVISTHARAPFVIQHFIDYTQTSAASLLHRSIRNNICRCTSLELSDRNNTRMRWITFSLKNVG